MKIIFKNNKEKENFFHAVVENSMCPSEITRRPDNCSASHTCVDCWIKYLDYEIEDPDIVEFAEEFFGCKLLEGQKEFLIKCYETYEEKGELHYIPARGCGNNTVLLHLQAVAALYDEFLKKEKRDGEV